MSKCPDCGRENVDAPMGHEAFCGRRVQYNDAPGVLYSAEGQWRERVSLAQKCKDAGKRRATNAVNIVEPGAMNTEELTATEIDLLRRDICPDCHATGFKSGPRGGAAQNIFCNSCGAGFNIFHPRYVIWGQRIGARKP